MERVASFILYSKRCKSARCRVFSGHWNHLFKQYGFVWLWFCGKRRNWKERIVECQTFVSISLGSCVTPVYLSPRKRPDGRMENEERQHLENRERKPAGGPKQLGSVGDDGTGGRYDWCSHCWAMTKEAERNQKLEWRTVGNKTLTKGKRLEIILRKLMNPLFKRISM